MYSYLIIHNYFDSLKNEYWLLNFLSKIQILITCHCHNLLFASVNCPRAQYPLNNVCILN